MNIEAKLSTEFVNKCFELCRGYPTHKSFQIRDKDINKKIEPGVRAWHIRHKRWVDVVAGMGGMLRVHWREVITETGAEKKVVRILRNTICLSSDLIMPYGSCDLCDWYEGQPNTLPNSKQTEPYKIDSAFAMVFLRPSPRHRVPNRAPKKD